MPIFHSLVTNAKATIRREMLMGKEHLVVPMVMMVSGVHTGTRYGKPASLFYPEDEMADRPYIWNSKPVVISHPENSSACTQEEINKRQVGQVLNTEYERDASGLGRGKWKAEAWLDPDRLKIVNPDVLDAVLNGRMLEISTGVFTDDEEKSGEHNGEKYDSIAHNLKPDHLAILVNEKGACSCKDGCGLNRNAEGTIVKNALSHSKVHDCIQAALNSGACLMKGSGISGMADRPASDRVADVYDDQFIFHSGDGKMYCQKYTMNSDSTVGVPDTEPQEVQLYSEYRTVKGGAYVGNSAYKPPIQKGESEMDKKKKIDQLIANTGFEETDRAYLDGLPETKLDAIIKKTTPAMVEAPSPAVVPVVNTATVPAPVILAQWLPTQPPEVQRAIQNLILNEQAQKKQYVDIIVANKKNPFSAEFLMAKDVPELQGLAAMVMPEESAVQNANGIRMFHGQQGGFGGTPYQQAPVFNAESVDEMFVDPPAMKFSA